MRAKIIAFSLALFACETEAGRGGALIASTSADAGGPEHPLLLLPFPNRVTYRCVQGAGGSYSHSGHSTRYDLDFDTPNDSDEVVVAPATGIAYTHHSTAGFGNHVNIDIGGELFTITGHLESFLVEDGQEVLVGQPIGIEGTTGYSMGDHIHFGLHRGDPRQDAVYSESIPAERIVARDATSAGTFHEIRSPDFVCDLDWGHTYESNNGVSRHPVGSLLKEHGRPEIYLVCGDGVICWVTSEDNFLSRRLYHIFSDPWARVIEVSAEEIDCYDRGPDLDYPVTMRFRRCQVAPGSADHAVYLTVDDRGHRYRRRSPLREGDEGFGVLLRSWGFLTTEIEEGGTSCSYEDGDALRLRDGTILQPSSDPFFYVITNDGLPYRLDRLDAWAMHFEPDQVLQVPSGVFALVTGGSDPDHSWWTRVDATMCGSPPPPGAPGGGGTGGDTPDAGTPAAPDAGPPIIPDAGVPCSPLTESCNRMDDDCDGLVDEGFPLDWDTGNCGACGISCVRPNAVYSCVRGSCLVEACRSGWADTDGNLSDGCECAIIVEICNGIDDDCDHLVDEGGVCAPPPPSCAPGLVQSCTAGCGSPGTRTCATDGLSWSVCRGYSESCNGADDDCDGRIDEGVCGPPPMPDAGMPPADAGTAYDAGSASCGHAVDVRFDGYAGAWRFGSDLIAAGRTAVLYVDVSGSYHASWSCEPPGWIRLNGAIAGRWMCEEWPLGSFRLPYGLPEVRVDGALATVFAWHDPSIPEGVGCNLHVCIGGGCSP